MCSGIPVISSGTPGLRENCGDAGIYVERDDIDGWVKAIKNLDKEYKKASEKSKARSRELDPVKELELFEEWLKKVQS
jgi:glycosyltransferase involved in cell wall biosynthesis